MLTRRLGSLRVSSTGAGLVSFGRDKDFPKAQRMIHAAIDLGLNFFDTGQNYGDAPDGIFMSEEFLGRALVGRRSRGHIATKFGYDDGRMPRTWVGFGNLEEQCDKALKKMRTDYIDIWQAHRASDQPQGGGGGRGGGGRGGNPAAGAAPAAPAAPPRAGVAPPGSNPVNTVARQGVPWDEALGQLARLKEKGKIREIGTTDGNAAHIKEVNAIADKHRYPRLVGTQSGMSLLSRNAARTLLPTLVEQKMGLIPISPLAGGFLTGKYKSDEPPPPGSRFSNEAAAQRQLTERNFKIIQALTAFAQSHKRTMLELAFGWLTAQPGMGSIIAGVSNEDQIVQNAKSSDWRMTPAQVAEATRIASSFDESVLAPPAAP